MTAIEFISWLTVCLFICSFTAGVNRHTYKGEDEDTWMVLHQRFYFFKGLTTFSGLLLAVLCLWERYS